MNLFRADTASGLPTNVSSLGKAAVSFLRACSGFLPTGHALPDEVWEQRHTGIVLLLWLHVVAITGYAVLANDSILHALAECSLMILAALLAGMARLGRKARAGAASFGLITASALLVHLSGGYVEMHFHFFVVVAIMALYQDWVPFSIAVGYVALHHGILGVLSPTSVFNHPAAWERPWEWALLHAGFLLAASVANLLAWRLNEHQALHDALTSLANRALLKDRVEHALARLTHEGRPIAVLFIDLDRFKAVNDSAGHTAGDQLLRMVGERLKRCVRAGDTIARLGGDEFAILLEDLQDARDAAMAARRMLDALAEPFMLRDRQVTIGASIGISVGTSGRQRYETLVRDADVAMYAAKSAGRGRFAMFEAGMHEVLVRRLKLEEDLRQAVDRAEFVLHYQPIIALDRGELAGVEALIRWAHPERGLVPPSEFISAAEDTGLIVPIGAWVLREACQQARAWHVQYPEKPPIRISVNLSTRQLEQQRIVRDVTEALAETGLDPEHLVLEVTESVLMEDTEANIATLRALKDLGVRLAIDDFGTGYSSLSYLRRFPVDLVKIDKSFIDGITDGPEESALARAIISLGQTLRLHTVAEGVEHPAQFDDFRELGCSLGQGFHFARPLSADAIGELLEQHVDWNDIPTSGDADIGSAPEVYAIGATSSAA